MSAYAVRKIDELDSVEAVPETVASAAPTRKTKRAAPSQSVVKSAGRVLEILEYFDDIRREADLTEIAQLLNYPRSSASALLRSLVAMGYLQYRNGTRTYFPTARVALLGHRKSPRFTRAGRVITQLREIRDRTGENLVLVQRNGPVTQIIETLAGTSDCCALPPLGMTTPLTASGLGLALLQNASPAELRKLSNRINADLIPAQRRQAQAALAAAVQDTKSKGFAEGSMGSGLRVIAFPLTSDVDHSALAIGIWGYEDTLLAKRQHSLETGFAVLGRTLPLKGDDIADTFRRAESFRSATATPLEQSIQQIQPVRHV